MVPSFIDSLSTILFYFERDDNMGKFTKEMVNDYADKLMIGLTEEENKMVLDEFEIIDKNIDLIKILEKTIYGSDGMGGIITRGSMYIGYPR